MVQIGPENTPGAPVNASKRLQALRLTPAVEDNVTKVTPMGYLYPTVVAEGQEWTTLDGAGVGAYTELHYLTSAIWGKVSGGSPTSLGSGAFQWVNQGAISSIDNAQTYSVEVGDSNFAEKASFGLFTDYNMKLTRKTVDLKAKMIAQLLQTGQTLSASHPLDEIQVLTPSSGPDAWTSGTFTLTWSGQTTGPISFDAFNSEVEAALTDLSNIGQDIALEDNVHVSGPAGGPWTVEFVHDLGGTPRALITADLTSIVSGGTKGITITEPQVGNATAAVSAISVVPILPKEGSIYLDTVFGSIGSTKLTRNFELDIDLTGKSGPMWPIDAAQTSWAAAVPMEPKSSMKLQLQADTAGLNPLAYLRSGQVVYIRVHYLSASIIGGSIHFEWTIDCAAKVETVGKFEDFEGVYVLNYTLQPVSDPTSGFAFRSTLVNGQSSL